MSKTTAPQEMLFCLNNLAHRHVWAPCTVSAQDRIDDPDTSAEEMGAVSCLNTYGYTCSPSAVLDQFGKTVTRKAK